MSYRNISLNAPGSTSSIAITGFCVCSARSPQNMAANTGERATSSSRWAEDGDWLLAARLIATRQLQSPVTVSHIDVDEDQTNRQNKFLRLYGCSAAESFSTLSKVALIYIFSDFSTSFLSHNAPKIVLKASGTYAAYKRKFTPSCYPYTCLYRKQD